MKASPQDKAFWRSHFQLSSYPEIAVLNQWGSVIENAEICYCTDLIPGLDADLCKRCGKYYVNQQLRGLKKK